MLLKLGVDISKLNRHTRRALGPVDKAYRSIGEESVISSTYEGDHAPGSLHYCNDAFDVRLPLGKEVSVGRLVAAIQQDLGSDYDVVLEKDHVHVEYDPKF